MKKIIVLILLLSEVHTFGEDGIPQHKINAAYEVFKRKQIDPEDLKKIESLSSSEIYEQLLSANPAPTLWKEIRIAVIKKRQKDLIVEMRNTLKEFPPYIDTIGKLSSLSSLVSPEFEAEIANGILENPASREFDILFLESEEFRKHFRTEPDLLKSALDRLLSEGRIKKNSAIHKKWKSSISKFDRSQKQREKQKLRNQVTNKQTREVQNEKASPSDKEKSPLSWLLILAILTFLAVVALLFKVHKNRALGS